ncbi:MAG TPA: exodeoxyribonuclease III [Candidatus Moranbacteria bacterium]|nr:exodeoxyribonuclease III [Candidatus Moranbacteria bacterium]
MKIITWNVNGLRAVERKKEIQKLLLKEQPDFLLIQEIKGSPEQFSGFLTEHPEYQQFYHSAEKKGYAGTGIWLKKNWLDKISNLNFIRDVDDLPNADEGRVAELDFYYGRSNFAIFSVYFPNGGKSSRAWEEKLLFYEKFLEHINQLRKEGKIVIVGGDVNVAHDEIDLARPKENDGKIGFHPKERAWMDRLTKDNWSDVWRDENPKKTKVYSYWDLKSRARERNVGWRIDYFFLDKKLLPKVKRIEYLTWQMGSDHCPLLMEI